jgi:predicted  nucleic acid-binding Zn-ribbon protein
VSRACPHCGEVYEEEGAIVCPHCGVDADLTYAEEPSEFDFKAEEEEEEGAPGGKGGGCGAAVLLAAVSASALAWAAL